MFLEFFIDSEFVHPFKDNSALSTRRVPLVASEYLAFGEGNVYPRKHCVEMEWTWIAWSGHDFSGIKQDSSNQNIRSAIFLVKYPKIFPNFRHRRFGLRDLRTSLFMDENPGRSHANFLSFKKSSKVSSTITLTMENMGNNVSFAVCKKMVTTEERHHAFL